MAEEWTILKRPYPLKGVINDSISESGCESLQFQILLNTKLCSNHLKPVDDRLANIFIVIKFFNISEEDLTNSYNSNKFIFSSRF